MSVDAPVAAPRQHDVRRWSERSSLEALRGRRILRVASTGGHLSQLVRLSPTLGLAEDSPWITFDTPQSRSLLAGQEVHYVPYVAPRDVRGIARAAQLARRLAGRCDGAVSTGAGLALSVLPQVAMAGRTAVYLESISRVDGPSLTGRCLRILPRVGLYAQHSGWLRGAWRLGPSVLSTYEARSEGLAPVRRVLVALGTIAPYRFDRLVDLVAGWAATRPDVEVVWQLGSTTRDDLPGDVRGHIPAAEFSELVAGVDVVVTHSGVGVAMQVLDAGKVPVMLDRRAALGEHVDDHQAQIHRYLIDRGLALSAEDVLAAGDGPERAAGVRIETVADRSFRPTAP